MEYSGQYYCTSYSKYFKYQWIAFHASDGADNTAAAILKFFYFKRVCFMPAAIKLLNAKSLNQFLYGAKLNLYSNYNFMENV